MMASRMRAALYATAVSMLVACAVAACGSSGGTQQSDASGQPPARSTKATLTVWHYMSPDFFAKNVGLAEKAFQRIYPNVRFKNLYVDFPDMRNKVLAAAAAGTGPDVLVFDPMDSQVLVKAGALTDIEAEWDRFPARRQWPNAIVWRADGKVTAVQSWVNTNALWYNADILRKAGVRPPRTVDELEQALAKVTHAGYEGLLVCGAPTNECETQAIPWVFDAGLNYDKLGSPAATALMQRWADWGKKGYVPKDAVGWSQPDAFNEFLKGRAAFAQNGNWEISHAKEAARFRFGIVPIPVDKSGPHVAPGGEGEAIGAFTKQRALAWQFLARTFFTKDLQLRILRSWGSIPAREDARRQVANDRLLAPFITEIRNGEQRPAIQGGDYQKATTVLGQIWSGLLSGQLSPGEATSTLREKVVPLFGTD